MKILATITIIMLILLGVLVIYINLFLKEELKLKERRIEVKDIEKLLIHNQVLLDIVLSKLGMSDEEIDETNKNITKVLEEEYDSKINEISND